MSATEATIFPVGTNASAHGIAGLDPDSYTAHKLKHSSPEHLHLTTRRFFIGPIPEGWLNSNRKSWYKRRLELSSYSSRPASFSAAAGQSFHHRTVTGLNASSTAARMSFSFPQPEDVDEPLAEDEPAGDTEEDEEVGESETRELEPVSTDAAELSSVNGDVDRRPGGIDGARVTVHDGDPTSIKATDFGPQKKGKTRPVLSPADTFHTARSHNREQSQTIEEPPTNGKGDQAATLTVTDLAARASTSMTGSSLRNETSLNTSPDNVYAGSRTALLAAESPDIRPRSASSKNKTTMQKREPAPVDSDLVDAPLHRSQTGGVRFKVSDAVVDRQRRVARRVDNTKNRVGNRLARRQTLLEGTIVKMEKMLVKIDFTMQKMMPEFDENEMMKTDTKVLEKWREYMVVARRAKKGDEDDFRLQFYKTRVIPEIEDESTKKKPTREIKLIRQTTHVNLFSSLDKTVVMWHPYKKGKRIIIMKAGSAAHSVEWYTFLRDSLGWHRPATLQVMVPDLDVSLHVEKPFAHLEAAGLEEDEHKAIAKAVEAEQAVAGRIVSQCIGMLESNPEWTSVMHDWHEKSKIGLAWKRYDRLEWVHGVNEQRMYGSMAMQHSYDLELRPKIHYPTHAYGKKGVDHQEPAPIEGFLIRLTSQRGLHKRLGKTFFKRLYFSTQNHFLVFNRPAKATPPHPPRLQTISGTNVPSASEIIEKTPTMYAIEPYQEEAGKISWLASGVQDRINRYDREAYEEARRNIANMAEADGYINLCRIKKVRKMRWGAEEADEAIDSGSDVDFHQHVSDSAREDGTTRELDDNRIFELLLDNNLIVRLQAYDKTTRDEWMTRLRKLVKYWKLRTSADMNNFKAIRQTNLERLKIDEAQEAELGQFGHKWEVSRSEANPEIHHVCAISSCRTIGLSGLLYRKARKHSTFQRCGVILSGGQLHIFQSTLRRRSGAQIANIHQEKQEAIDLRDCYVYSGLIVEDDLLYQNRTFDANHMGVMASLPRVWVEDGWTSSDVDVMCCFVVWMNRRKGWFRTAGSKVLSTVTEQAQTRDGPQARQRVQQEDGGGVDNNKNKTDGQRARLKRVGQLGVPGRGVVFKCRSRAERDLWVLQIASEIERMVEKKAWEEEQEGGDVRMS